MKTFSLFRFTVLFGIAFHLSTLCFAQFENTIGNLVGSDETSDVKPLPNGHTIMLANSTSFFGGPKIVLTELDAAGHPVFFKVIFDAANVNVPYTGNSLELDLDAAGNPSGYFITGCKGEFPTQMIVLRTDLNGVPTWARQMDGGSDPNSLISECGISIERQPNRDIIAVGRSDEFGDLRFTVSRLSSFGVLIWSYRYGSTAGHQLLPNESCNGMRNHEEVVAVVGHVHDSIGIGHTYLSCIKASNGMEFWRNQYTSDHYHDDGTDVVQNPLDQRYFIEGHAEDFGSGTKLWTIVANGNNGNLSSSATYSLLPPFLNLFGRDICFNPNDATVAITGFIVVESSFEPVETRTFILNMPFLAGAVPNFSHYFKHSEPELFLLADDAIEFFGGPNPGYVIGTQAKLPFSGPFDYDLHALRLNLLGRHNLADCPIVLFTPEINPEGTMDRLKKNKTPSTWSNLELISVVQDYIEDPCNGPIIAPPGNVFQTIPTSSSEAALFPNPAHAGGEINLRFEMTTSSEVTIEIFDITGRQVYQLRQWQDSGLNLIRFSLPTDLSEKLYAVKLGFSDGQNRVFRLLME